MTARRSRRQMRLPVGPEIGVQPTWMMRTWTQMGLIQRRTTSRWMLDRGTLLTSSSRRGPHKPLSHNAILLLMEWRYCQSSTRLSLKGSWVGWRTSWVSKFWIRWINCPARLWSNSWSPWGPSWLNWVCLATSRCVRKTRTCWAAYLSSYTRTRSDLLIKFSLMLY